jgi:hypothetical protein
LRRIDASEVHNIHWTPEKLGRGKLVEEKSLEPSEASSVSADDGAHVVLPTSENHRYVSLLAPKRPNSNLVAVVARIHAKLNHHRKRTGPAALEANIDFVNVDTENSSACPTLASGEAVVSESRIPNAAFARKFGLFTDGHALPPSIKELPVAEDKAVDNAEGSATRGINLPRAFQGPFTPQLWFDGGLDYMCRRR